MIKLTQCMKCEYKYRRKRGGKNDVREMTCSAFPKGIPDEIYKGEVSHTKVLRGQEGEFIYKVKKEYKELDEKKSINNFSVFAFLKREKEKVVRVLYKKAIQNIDFVSSWNSISIEGSVIEGVFVFEDLMIHYKGEVKFISVDSLNFFLQLNLTRIIEKEEGLLSNIKKIKIEIDPNMDYSFIFT